MKKQMQNSLDNKQGHVLILSLVLVGLISSGAAMLHHMTQQKVFVKNKQVNRTRALLIAEAGVHQVFAELTLDFDLANEPFEPLSINGGTCDVLVTDRDPDSSGVVKIIRGKGSYLGAEETVALIIMRDGTSSTPDSPVDPDVLKLIKEVVLYGNRIVSGGNAALDLGGGDLFGHTVKTTGSARIKEGQVYIEEGGSWSGNISPAPETGAARPSISIDMEPFQQFAAVRNVSGNYNSGGTSWNRKVLTDSYISASELSGTWPRGRLRCDSWGGSIRPKDGVLYVEGDVFLASNTIVDGTIIATGTITVAGPIVASNSTGLPLFVSINGSVIIDTNPRITGFVYAEQGDVHVGGNVRFTGSIIAADGDVDVLNSSYFKYKDYTPIGPNGEAIVPEAPPGDAGGIPKAFAWVE